VTANCGRSVGVVAYDAPEQLARGRHARIQLQKGTTTMANTAKGLVDRLFVSSDNANIRLQIPEAQSPADGYFALEVGHTNYQALYSLALSAAINRYPLLIRTQGEISSSTKALVQYMVVDW
jgi:hypothetical protein